MTTHRCTYCDRDCTNPQGKAAHERNCPENLNRPTKKNRPPGEKQREVVRALEACGGQATLDQMLAVKGVKLGKRSGLFNAISPLIRKGVCERTGPGTYRLTGRSYDANKRARDAAREEAIYNVIRKHGGRAHIDTIKAAAAHPASEHDRVLAMTRQKMLVRSSERGYYEIGPFGVYEAAAATPQHNTFTNNNNGARTEPEVTEVTEVTEIADRTIDTLLPLAATTATTTTLTSARASVRDARARLQADAQIGSALAALFEGTEVQHWTRLIEWIDLTREILGGDA